MRGFDDEECTEIREALVEAGEEFIIRIGPLARLPAGPGRTRRTAPAHARGANLKRLVESGRFDLDSAAV